MKTKKIKKLTKAKIRKQERIAIKKKFIEWSKNVRERDNNTCVINEHCGNSKILHAHHIYPRQIKFLRFDIDNGCTLCCKHHKYSYEISPHKNPLTFLLWLIENRREQYDRLTKKYREGKNDSNIRL